MHARLKYLIGLYLACCLLSGSMHVTLAGKQSPEDKKAAPTPYVDTDGYQIFANLLAGEKASSFVIQAETESFQKTTPKNLGIKGDAKFMKLWGVALRDLATEYRTPKLLGKYIPLAVPYEIVPEERLTEVIDHGRGWATFYEQYPLAHGYYSFSPVGFNAAKTRAIVWMTYSCDGLCGAGGTYHFFEKRGGRWREVSVKAEVIMMAS
jgi:hypothetical protein